MIREFIYPTWARLTRASQRASRRTSERGRMVGTALIVCGALGVDTDLSLVYQVFALLLSLLVFSRIAVNFDKPNVSVKRRLPKYATAGEPFEYYIDVVNEGNKIERDLSVQDNPLVKPPTFDEFSKSREPGEETRNVWDRFIGFHRFVWLQRRKTGLVTKPHPVADVNVKSKASTRIEATPLRRGIVNFRSTTVMHPDPLGLNYGLTNFETPEQLLVLPRRYYIPANFEVPGGRHFQPGGINATWSIGESDEFASLRDYRDGDSLRKIHWSSSAKRGKPVVKEFQDEYFVRQALVLDTTSDDPNVLDGAVSVTASFALRMHDSESLLDLVYLGDAVEMITSGTGRDNLNRQLEALACVGTSSLPLSLLVNAVTSRAGTLAGVIVVLTTWTDEHAELLEPLRASGIGLEVFLVQKEIRADVPAWVRQLAVEFIGEGLAAL